jgi:hypothetical protein
MTKTACRDRKPQRSTDSAAPQHSRRRRPQYPKQWREATHWKDEKVKVLTAKLRSANTQKRKHEWWFVNAWEVWWEEEEDEWREENEEWEKRGRGRRQEQ